MLNSQYFWGFFLLIALVSLLIMGRQTKKKAKKDQKVALRPIPALNEFTHQQGNAIESGTRVHLSAGTSGISGEDAAAALLAVTNMEVLAKNAAASDRPLIATTGDGATSMLLQSRLHNVYESLNLKEEYNPLYTQMTGPTPFSYVGGALPLVHDGDVSVNIVTGKVGLEAALLAEAGRRNGAYFIGASTDLAGQAVLYPASDQPLIGEEMFGTQAIMDPENPRATAGVKTQDVLRLVICGMLVIGSLLKLVGVI